MSSLSIPPTPAQSQVVSVLNFSEQDQEPRASAQARSLPMLLTAIGLGALVALVLLPLISALTGAVSGHQVTVADWVLALGVLWITAVFVLRTKTLRAAVRRGLLCLGAALVLTPSGLSVMVVFHLQDWATFLSSTPLHQTGSIATVLFGGVVIANLLVLGLIIAAASFLIGRSIA